MTAYTELMYDLRYIKCRYLYHSRRLFKRDVHLMYRSDGKTEFSLNSLNFHFGLTSPSVNNMTCVLVDYGFSENIHVLTTPSTPKGVDHFVPAEKSIFKTNYQ